MYSEFPQLIPFSGMRMDMQLHVSGDGGNIISRLKDCNINWVNDPAVPQVFVSLTKVDKGYKVQYSVSDSKRNVVVKQNTFFTENSAVESGSAGVNLAYRLFNVGESAVSDPAAAQKVNNQPL